MATLNAPQRRAWGRLLVLTLSLTVLVACGKKDNAGGQWNGGWNNGPVGVRTVQAIQGSLERRVAFTGELAADQIVELSPELSGRLTELRVDQGDVVEAGDEIATISTSVQAAKLREGEARIRSAAAREQEARSQYERSQNEVSRREGLTERSAYPAAELERLRDDVAVAAQALEVARAQRAEAEAANRVTRAEIGQGVIVAPIRGVVSERFLTVGAMVSTQTPILRIVDPASIRFVVSLPESSLATVHVGTQASIMLDGLSGTTFQGTVSRIASEVSRESRTVRVEMAVEGPGELRDGMFGRGTIVMDRVDNATIIPFTALVPLREGDYRVWVVGEGDRVSAVPVEIRLQTADEVAVTGISSGTRVVINPPMGLEDDETVFVVEERVLRGGTTGAGEAE